jgi:hypothetical protein
MSESSKPRKHTPYSKKVLIPLWTIQLGLSVFLVIYTLLIIGFVLPFFPSPFHLPLHSLLTRPFPDTNNLTPTQLL